MNLQPNPPELDSNPEDVIVLPRNCSTVTAEELKVRLVLAADFAEGIYIDASEVESVGQAVIQLLMAARIEASDNGAPYEIQSPSPAFRARIEALGLGEALGLAGRQSAVAHHHLGEPLAANVPPHAAAPLDADPNCEGGEPIPPSTLAIDPDIPAHASAHHPEEVQS